MTKKISETKPVIDFIDMATKYCQLIENRDNKTKIHLLQEAFIILIQLCQCGMRLPDIEKIPDYEGSKISNEKWKEVYESLQNKLKRWDWYKQMFDPFERRAKKPLIMSLSDDFSEIYQDIKPGLQDWETATPAERLHIIWDWKFGFEIHWGDHATTAFRSLFSLLYDHITDKYGDHIGLR